MAAQKSGEKPDYDTLVAENKALTAENQTLFAAIVQLQGALRQKDDEIQALSAPPPRVLDKNAKDMFARPYMGQTGGRR